MSRPILQQANAHFVTDFLAIGGDLAYDDATAVAQAVELINAGITHVLDVRQEWNDAELWSHAPEISYRWDGIDDAGQKAPAIWFDGVLRWATEALRTPGARLLTHCHMGINRGPSAGFAVLLGLGWDPVDALDAIRSARPIAAVGYADDALAWHLDRTRATPAERAEARARMRAWSSAHPLDVVRIIRSIRMGEAS